MPGTCVDVLKGIQVWLHDFNLPNIFWLSGSPGSGKTTIASTIVADFESFSGQFFFHHDQAEFCDPDNLWRHLALDLALGNNALGKSIAKALGLYIWAKSAMDFILHRGGDTEERLNVIFSDSGEGINAIDTLYQHIVFVAFQGLREVEKKSLSSVLGAIVIAKNPLRASDLEQLLGVQDTLSIISQLSPVLLISDTGHLHICCGRTEVQHKETETSRLPRNEEIRKKERDKDKELMKEGLSAGDM